MVVVGWEFTRWVHGLEAGRVVGERPPGVEAFLPIAALLSLRHLGTTGEVHPVHPAGLAILLLVVGISVLAKKAFCFFQMGPAAVATLPPASTATSVRRPAPRACRWRRSLA